MGKKGHFFYPAVLIFFLLGTCKRENWEALRGAFTSRIVNNIVIRDPSMILEDSTFYLYGTGTGILCWSSGDLINWHPEPPVFETAPPWTIRAIPGFSNDIWAPDISFHNGQYYLFYSVSQFSTNLSAIGYATNKTLNKDDPEFQWVDHGPVLQSIPGQNGWNAIDPSFTIDDTGTPWVAFGSFWGGIKLTRLSKDSLIADRDQLSVTTLASQSDAYSASDMLVPGGNAIEAPFLFKKNDFYYLFASIGYCCLPYESTYQIIVGRSPNVAGPYLDKSGAQLEHGGGSMFFPGNKLWQGVGHNAICTANGIDYLVCHGYDMSDGRKPKLRIEVVQWDEQGWPYIVN